MYICKQNKFQLVHLYAERDRARAGRYSSIWKLQFGRAALKSTILVAVGSTVRLFAATPLWSLPGYH